MELLGLNYLELSPPGHLTVVGKFVSALTLRLSELSLHLHDLRFLSRSRVGIVLGSSMGCLRSIGWSPQLDQQPLSSWGRLCVKPLQNGWGAAWHCKSCFRLKDLFEQELVKSGK